MTKYYGIYDGKVGEMKFTGGFAVTSHEAYEWCNKQALSYLRTLTSENTPDPKRVLWYGEIPEVLMAPGSSQGTTLNNSCVYLAYGKPGPNRELVHVIRFTKVKSWVGSEAITQEILYSIECREIKRVSLEESSPPIEIISSGIGSTGSPPKRDVLNPRDVLLSSIEKRRKD